MRKFLIGLLIASLFLCEISYSAVNWQKVSYFRNFGGLNDSQSTTEIADNEATDLQNVVFDTGGAIKKRYGYSNIITASIPRISTGTAQGITGLQFWKRNNATRSMLAIVNNNGAVLAYANGAPDGSTFPASSWMEVSSGDSTQAGVALPPINQTNNDLVDFTVGEDTLVFAMPARTPIKPKMYQATGSINILSNDSDLPTASLCEYHKNHLFLAGNTTYPSRVYFSALGNIYDWTATDFFDVETNDGTKVQALISAYDSLYIFKDNSIWRLSGTNRDDVVLQLMVKNVGTTSFNSVKLLKDGIFFTTAQGDIAAYDGGYQIVFLSSKIRNTIGGLNFSRAKYTMGGAYSTYRYNDYDYYIAVSQAGKSENDTILLFDTEKKAWTKFNGMTVSSMTVGETSAGQDKIYFGDNSGYVYSYPSTSYYDGDVITASINSFYQTKWFIYPELALSQKIWRRCKPYFISESAGSTVSIECKADYEATGTTFTMDLSFGSSLWDSAIFDTSTWGGQSLITSNLEVERGYSMFQTKFSNANLNEGFTLLGFENFLESTSGGI